MYFPKQPFLSKSMLQAIIYKACTDNGLVAYIDMWTSDVFYDVAIIEGEEVIAIIEVGNTPERKKEWNRTQGVSVFRIYSEFDVPDLIVALKKVQKEHLSLQDQTSKELRENVIKVNWNRDIDIQSIMGDFNILFPNFVFSEKYSRQTIVDVLDRHSLECVMYWLDKSDQQPLSEQEKVNYFFTALKEKLNGKKSICNK